VLPIKNYGNQTLLRIESPRIELEQTCITIHDRPNCPYSGSRQRLKLLCDPATTITALSKIGIEVDDTLAFTDINGITWQLGDTQKRRLDS
jgi:hypothetical protein